MLKWLLHRSHDPSLPDIITDDPLATLDFGHLKKKKRESLAGIGTSGHREIYSVSRTNPLYVGDCHSKFSVDEEVGVKLSPKLTSRSNGSSSSGYSSQKQENEDEDQTTVSSQSNVRSVLTARTSGLEFDMEPDLVRNSVTRRSVPEPVWPPVVRVQGIVANQVKIFNERMSPRSPSENQANEMQEPNQSQPLGQSTEIETTESGTRARIMSKKHLADQRRISSHYQPNRDMSPIGECPSLDETEEERKVASHNDSIVTDALLRMTDKAMPLESSQEQSEDSQDASDSPRRTEDMDKVIRELTMAVMKSRNVATLTRALKTTRKIHPESNEITETVESVESIVSSRGKNRLRNSLRRLKSISGGSMGVDLMRDLWRQTGMKTNGRKLLADTLDQNIDLADVARYRTKRRRRKRACKLHRCVQGDDISTASPSPKLSSRSISGSCSSDTSPPYVDTRTKRPLTYSSSTEVYAEVYQEDNSSGHVVVNRNHVHRHHQSGSRYKRGISNADTIDLDEIDLGTSTTCYTTSSQSSSPSITCSRKSSTDRKSGSSDKRVQFSHDVRDNETSGQKLIYERIIRASPPKSKSPFVIDVARLNSGSYGYNHPNSAWETYYGAAEMSTDVGSKTSSQVVEDSYKSVFTSPYFDYRKTHSKAGSVYGSSDLTLDQPHTRLLRQRHQRQKEDKQKKFWKLFAILLAISLVVAIIIALTIYITYGRSTIIKTT